MRRTEALHNKASRGSFSASSPEIGQSADGHNQTITAAGQPASVHRNLLASGDFQPLTWGGMWGTSRVPEKFVARSIRYGEGDKASRSAKLPNTHEVFHVPIIVAESRSPCENHGAIIDAQRGQPPSSNVAKLRKRLSIKSHSDTRPVAAP